MELQSNQGGRLVIVKGRLVVLRKIWIPDEELPIDAAWIVAIINNRPDAVSVIGERLELRQARIAALEAEVKAKDNYIDDLEAQLQTYMKMDAADITPP